MKYLCKNVVRCKKKMQKKIILLFFIMQKLKMLNYNILIISICIKKNIINTNHLTTLRQI